MFEYWPPEYVTHDHLPFVHDIDEIFIWPDMTFVGDRLILTAHAPVEFAAYSQYLPRVVATTSSRTGERAAKVPK
jgi:hypothetical protein